MNYKYLSIVIVAGVVLTIVSNYYYRRRFPNASGFDVAIFKLKVSIAFTAFALYAVMLLIPYTFFYQTIFPDDSSATVSSKLISNQETLHANVSDLKDAVSLIVLLISVFLIGDYVFIRSLENSRRELEESNPETKRPLGL